MVLLNKQIEEASLHHWPALSTDYVDTWKLRFTNGYTKRSNSISSIYGVSKQMNLNIAICEQKYSAVKQPTIFKITPFSEPQLDETLEQLNYEIVDPSMIMTLDLKRLSSTHPPLKNMNCKHLKIRAIEHISIEWLQTYCKLNEVDPKHIPTMIDMMASIQGKLKLITCTLDSTIVAMMITVTDDHFIGVYDLVTAKEYRNHGIASYMLWSILSNDISTGMQSYLAVIKQNEAAIHLYNKLGFKPEYNYWYRVKY